ncbi:hypothetical protein N7457_005200 [Penicillium paradoxum]|uniref:uncharacterized protein n=1 Tax=Penicillium paradoxum TaxID=176176 RepID=UPI002548FA7C|nr:uncharacterized protein N7457_005200 [Penicillium paradoxum]KAJ5780040.1 hypothetical protein N7457_005200 [Penicillium paradoxum]
MTTIVILTLSIHSRVAGSSPARRSSGARHQISQCWTPKTQGLAGAVFNTVAQFGTSIELTSLAIISAGVMQGSRYSNKDSPKALMAGYRAVFWTCFALMIAACGVGTCGLRKVEKVGLKRE